MPDDLVSEARKRYREYRALVESGSRLSYVEWADGFPRIRPALDRVHAESAEHVGRRVGRFELVAPLGRGGMGEVWEAIDRESGTSVALKLLPPERHLDPRAVLRFRREADAGTRLEHPYIARILDAGLAEDQLYIAQELVAGGRTLADVIADEAARPERDPEHVPRVVQLIANVADALQSAHDAGILHRDIKPQNIMVAADGTPRVVDFGLARVEENFTISQTGELAGTIAYMSPEQALGKHAELDERSDVFSLGATLYEALTLRRPFEGDSAAEVLDGILRVQPMEPSRRAPGLAPAVSRACMRALEKPVDERFASMKELARALGPVPGSAAATGKLGQDRRVGSSTKAPLPGGWLLAKPIRLFVALGIAAAVVAAAVWLSRDDLTTRTRRLALRFAEAQVREAEQRLSEPTSQDAARALLSGVVIEKVTVPLSSSLSTAIGDIPELVDLSVVVDAAAERAFVEEQSTVELELQHPIRGDRLLGLLLDVPTVGPQLVYSLEGGRVEVMLRENLPLKVELVHTGDFMTLSPDVIATGSGVGLQDLLQESIRFETWGDPGVSINANMFNRLTVVQRPDVLREVLGFTAGLRRVYLGDLEPWIEWPGQVADPEDLQARERLISTHVRLPMQPGTNVDLRDFTEKIASATGIDCQVHLRAPSEGTAYVDSVEGELGNILDRFVAQFSGLVWTVQYGVILITTPEREPVVGRIYRTSDVHFVHPTVNDEGFDYYDFGYPETWEDVGSGLMVDALDAHIRDLLAPDTWDSDLRRSSRVLADGTAMVVVQTRAVHAEIERLLEDLRR